MSETSGAPVGQRLREIRLWRGLSLRAVAELAGFSASYQIGRGLASSKSTRDEAIRALLRAEELAPQRIRAHPLLRETVADLHRRSRAGALDRDLRGLAWRMGVAVVLDVRRAPVVSRNGTCRSHVDDRSRSS